MPELDVPHQRRRQPLQRAARLLRALHRPAARSTSPSATSPRPTVASCSCSPGGRRSSTRPARSRSRPTSSTKMLGDTSHVGAAGTTGARRVDGELDVVPGMLLNRLNPLKGLSDDERQELIAEFREQGGGVRQPRPPPRADGRAGHRQGADVPGARARHRVRVRRRHRRALRQHPRVQPLDARGGRVRRPRTACSCRPTSRSPTPTSRCRSSRCCSTHGRADDPDQVGPRARRARQPVRRPLARRSRVRPRSGRICNEAGVRARRAPRRHRLPEVRRRLVARTPSVDLRRLRRVPVGHVLGRPPRDGAHRRR